MMTNDFCPNCFEKRRVVGKCEHCGYDETIEHDSNGYLLPGTILDGKYMVGKVLGHGGFGITYLGTDLSIKTKIAIKEYMPAGIAHRDIDKVSIRTYKGDKGQQYSLGFTRFIKEAKVLSRFNAVSSIVSVYDVFKANGTAYMIMEYLEGETLSNHIKTNGALSSKEVVKMIMPVLDSLEKVHMANIIHRDIALDNLYLLKNGSVKLLDFGAARYAFAEKAKSLSIVLKPGYAPIEQYSRKGSQGPWTDIYALAATMFAMITGEAPPDSTDRIAGEEIVYPKQIDNHLKKVLTKALSISGRDRYQSIEEFRAALLSKKSLNKAVEKSKEDKLVSAANIVAGHEVDNIIDYDRESDVDEADNIRLAEPDESEKEIADNDNVFKKFINNKKYIAIAAAVFVVAIGSIFLVNGLNRETSNPVIDSRNAVQSDVSSESETANRTEVSGETDAPSGVAAKDYANFNFVLWDYLDGIIIDLNTDIENEKLQVLYSIDGGEWKEALDVYIRDGFSLSATHIDEHIPQSDCDLKVVNKEDNSIVYDTYHVDAVDIDYYSNTPTLNVLGVTANTITVTYGGVTGAEKVAFILQSVNGGKEKLTYVEDEAGTFTYTIDGDDNPLLPGTKYRVAVMYEFFENDMPYIFGSFSKEVALPKNNDDGSMYMVDDKTYDINLRTDGSYFFREPLIEKAVRHELGVDDEYILTENDLLNVRQILLCGVTPFDNLSQYYNFYLLHTIDGKCNEGYGNITSLEDLQKMKNLKTVVLDKQNIADISPLADLSITELYLSSNIISDISPVEQMTELKQLSISDNLVDDISSFAELNNLEFLDISFNPITNISCFSGKTINKLSLMSVPIDDYSILQQVNSLTELEVENLNNEELEMIGTLTRLESLTIFHSSITSVETLKDLKNLNNLHIGHNDNLSDISAIGELRGLTSLAVNSTSVTSIEPIKDLKMLSYLSMFELDISDIEILLGMPYLQFVECDQKHARELEQLSDNIQFDIEINYDGT